MQDFKYVILGGGTLAGYAAQQMVEEGLKKDELAIISAETYPPIERPPLSKTFLRNEEEEDDFYVNEHSFYEKHGIHLLLGKRANDIDFGIKSIMLSNDEIVKYENLIIATGSAVNRFNGPGNELDGIYYLRSRKDSKRIKEAAQSSRNAVVVGDSYIGSEVAASLTQKGIQVRMVIEDENILSRFDPPEMIRFFTDYFENKGVIFAKRDRAIAFEGKNGKVEIVRTQQGLELPADMVVAGIGVHPATDIFEGKGLEMEDGFVIINEYGETNLSNVYAAGDVVKVPDYIFGGSAPVPHWDNAHRQGKHIGKVLMGKREPYEYLTYFFSDIFDLSYEYFGDHKEGDRYYIVGNLDEGDFSVWWMKDNHVVCAFIMGSRPDEEREKAREWISKQQLVKDSDVLAFDKAEV